MVEEKNEFKRQELLEKFADFNKNATRANLGGRQDQATEKKGMGAGWLERLGDLADAEEESERTSMHEARAASRNDSELGGGDKGAEIEEEVGDKDRVKSATSINEIGSEDD